LLKASKIVEHVTTSKLKRQCIALTDTSEKHQKIYRECTKLLKISNLNGLLNAYSYRDLRIPRSRLSRYGSRSFSVSGPTAWNSLPTAVYSDLSSSSCFCRHLKTELFSRAWSLLELGKHSVSHWPELDRCKLQELIKINR